MSLFSSGLSYVKRFPLLLTLDKFAHLYSNTHLLAAVLVAQTSSYSCNPCYEKALTENRESCVSRVHTKRIICHTSDGATVCCSQTIYGKCAADMVSSIFRDHNLKSPILTNTLHAMHP